MKQFAPLLAATIDPKKDPDVFKKIQWPLLGSPKLDGIRCIVRDGKCVSRKLLPIPRPHVQERFSHLEHFDGELIVGNPTDHDVYNRTQSYVMSKDERMTPLLTFHVFDWAKTEDASIGYSSRITNLLREAIQTRADVFGVAIVPQKEIRNLDELLTFEAEVLEQGYEGIMLRSSDGTYKFGRSTFNQATLMKLKRFEDDEAEVIGYVEQQRNENEAGTDELGHTKRSSAKAGMVNAGTLGKFIVNFKDQELEIPPGVLKKEERQEVWDNRDFYFGKTLKFRHFPHGAKDKPRLPRFVGWRTAEDM